MGFFSFKLAYFASLLNMLNEHMSNFHSKHQHRADGKESETGKGIKSVTLFICCCQRLYMVIHHSDYKFLILLQIKFSGVAKQILVQNASNVLKWLSTLRTPFHIELHT